MRTGMAVADDWNLRGLTYFAQRDYVKAANDFRMAALTDRSQGVFWANLGDARTETGEFAIAIDAYTTAMRNGDDTAEVRRKRGWARYQLESFDNALEDYSKAITLDADNVDNFNERGLVRHGMQAYMAAISDFDQALKLQSDNAVVLTNRALSYSRLGNVEKAHQLSLIHI